MARSIGSAATCVALLLWLGGCATAPSAAPPAAEEYLAGGQSAYIAVDVAGNEDLVSFVVGSLGGRGSAIVGRITMVSGSLDLSSSDSALFSAVAFGNFPAGATRYGLRRDRNFARSVTGTGRDRLVYFRQVDGSLEIALLDSGTILMSTGSVVGLARGASSRPSSAVAAGQGSEDDARAGLDARTAEALRSAGTLEGPDFVVVLPEPASILTGRLGLELPRFPIRRLSLFATAAGLEAADSGRAGAGGADLEAPATRIQLAGAFEFSSETEAALFGRLGRVFIIAFVRSLGLPTTGLRDTVGVVVDGRDLRFDGVTMSALELADLTVRLTGRDQ